MRISLAAFTDRGAHLAARIAQAIRDDGDTAEVRRIGEGVTLGECTENAFRHNDAIVFVGAVGIAVRAIAPYVRDKTTDPAVVAIDDCGLFAVAVLSGHIGGANELAERIAGITGATPVITTATDIQGVFAIDTWAVRNGLAIHNPAAIKHVSGKLLRREEITIASAFRIAGTAPENVRVVQREAGGDVVIGYDCPGQDDQTTLFLTPKTLVLGVGCRRGVLVDAVRDAFEAFCQNAGVCPEAVGMIASIDIKKDEPALIEFAAGRGVLFATYTAEELQAVPGEFAASAFVQEQVGVDNVSERAAVLASAGGTLRKGKTKFFGITLALAERLVTVTF